MGLSLMGRSCFLLAQGRFALCHAKLSVLPESGPESSCSNAAPVQKAHVGLSTADGERGC